ncbi:hypothetical protein DUI70_4322 [Streptomyces albus]|nr:hypothetical protein DUI70_4322 [Streptomyces albus]
MDGGQYAVFVTREFGERAVHEGEGNAVPDFRAAAFLCQK